MTKSVSFKRVLRELISRFKSSVFMGEPFKFSGCFERVCLGPTGRVARNTPNTMVLDWFSRPNLEHVYAN